jgi:hypothetical protein
MVDHEEPTPPTEPAPTGQDDLERNEDAIAARLEETELEEASARATVAAVVKMNSRVTPGAGGRVPEKKESKELEAAAKATTVQGRADDGKPAGLLDSWGTGHTANGEVVFQLKDSNGNETRWTTTPVFARDLSNRLLQSAAKAQLTLQAGTIGEGG